MTVNVDAIFFWHVHDAEKAALAITNCREAIDVNAPIVRSQICAGLGFLGIEPEGKRNAANEGVISAAAGGVAVRVIRTDEELTIARSVCRVLDLGANT